MVYLPISVYDTLPEINSDLGVCMYSTQLCVLSVGML